MVSWAALRTCAKPTAGPHPGGSAHTGAPGTWSRPVWLPLRGPFCPWHTPIPFCPWYNRVAFVVMPSSLELPG